MCQYDFAFSSDFSASDTTSSVSFSSVITVTHLSSPALIVLESSERGCPLHFIVKDLYQPKGARLTSKDAAFSISSSFFSTSIAVAGDERLELKWA